MDVPRGWTPQQTEQLELIVTRTCIVSLCWLFPTGVFVLGAVKDAHAFDGRAAELPFWELLVFLPGILAVSMFLTMVLRRLVVATPVNCFQRKALAVMGTIWVFNPLVVLLVGTLVGQQWIKEASCVPMLVCVLGLCTNRKLCDCQRRYNFSRRVDPDSGLVLRENETVMWVVSRLGLIVIPFSLLNMQLSLYGAAAEAPKRWEIISKMAALGLGFSTLILAKFIAVIVTIGQGMDTRCTPFLIGRVVFFLFLFSGDWLSMKLIMLKPQNPGDLTEDERRRYATWRLGLVLLSYACGCSLLVLSVSPAGRIIVKKLAELLGSRGRRRTLTVPGAEEGSQTAFDPSTQFLAAAEPFNRRKHVPAARTTTSSGKKEKATRSSSTTSGATRTSKGEQEKEDREVLGSGGGDGVELEQPPERRKSEGGGPPSPRNSVASLSTHAGETLETPSEMGSELQSVIVDDGSSAGASRQASFAEAGAAGTEERPPASDGPSRWTTIPSSPWSKTERSSGALTPEEDKVSRAMRGEFTDSDEQTLPNRTGRPRAKTNRPPMSSEHVIRNARPKRLNRRGLNGGAGGSGSSSGGHSTPSDNSPSSNSGAASQELADVVASPVLPSSLGTSEQADPRKEPLLSSSSGARDSSSSPDNLPFPSRTSDIENNSNDRVEDPNPRTPAHRPIRRPSSSDSSGDLTSENSLENACCTICLAEFDDGEMIRTMPQCYHIFHAVCLEKWARTQGSTCLCPMCRRPVFADKGAATDSLAHLEAQDVREQITSEESAGLILRSRPLSQSLNVDILIAALCVRILENDIQSAAHVLLEHKSLLLRLQTRRRLTIDPLRAAVLSSWADGIIAADGCLDETVKRGLMLQLQAIEWDAEIRSTEWERLTDPQKTTVYSLMLGDVIDRLNSE